MLNLAIFDSMLLYKQSPDIHRASQGVMNTPTEGGYVRLQQSASVFGILYLCIQTA